MGFPPPTLISWYMDVPWFLSINELGIILFDSIDHKIVSQHFYVVKIILSAMTHFYVQDNMAFCRNVISLFPNSYVSAKFRQQWIVGVILSIILHDNIIYIVYFSLTKYKVFCKTEYHFFKIFSITKIRPVTERKIEI